MAKKTSLKHRLLKLFKPWLEKYLRNKILGSIVGGIKGFFFKLFFKILWERGIYRLFSWADAAIKLKISKWKNKKNIKKVDDAKTSDEVRDSFDDLLNGK